MQEEAIYCESLQKARNSIRFFDQRNNEQQFTVHGQDAKFVAQELFRTETVLKYTMIKSVQSPYCVINKQAAQVFMRDLIQKGYRLEIYEFNNKKYICNND